jgi:hypothetical protein
MSEHQPPTESELIELLHAADVRAPDSLHRSVQAMVQGRGRGARWRGVLLGGSLAAAAAVVVVLALLLAGGGSQRLTVEQATAVTLRAATQPAPGEDPHAHGQLTETVDGVAFPYWKDAFGFKARGARTDTIDGRKLITVFYADSHGQSIGYAIASGPPLPGASGGEVQMREGTDYRAATEKGVRVVTWVRDGHLCILTAHDVSFATLVELASWRPEPA